MNPAQAHQEANRAGIAAARAALNKATSEHAFMSSVIDLAHLRNWRVWHDNDSRRNNAGLPDLILIRAPNVIFAELKKHNGRPTCEQQQWLAELDRCTTVQAHLWRPDDWAQIEEVLR